MESQSASAVLMVRPARFAFNPETAASNAFQSSDLSGLAPALGDGAVQSAAMREFDNLANQLIGLGVQVVVAEDTLKPAKPDAVFPNNWVSFHRDGTVVLYPMQAPNRRLERREEVIRQVLSAGFRAARTLDLSHHEAHGRFLEGTGSLVLDRANRVAYAALSPRTHRGVLGEFARALDYELVTFDAADAGGIPIYHTNVLMAVGAGFAVLCSEAIREGERTAVLDRLHSGGHRVLEITSAQMQQFAGNLLELASTAGSRIIALSSAAWSSFTAPQRRTLESHGQPCVAPIPVIERLGGGSIRCMLAEIHLPESSAARVIS